MGLVYNTPPESGYSEETLADGKKVFTSTTRTNENRLTSFNLQYPNNITGSPEYGNGKHRVVFLINVSGMNKTTKAANNNGTGSVNTSNVSTGGSVDYRQLQTNVNPADSAQLANGGQTGQQTGETVKGLLSNIPGINRLGITKQMKRLSAAIVLYMPNNIQNSYSVNWETEDIYNLTAIAGFAGAGLAAYTGINPSKVMEALQPGMQRTIKTAGVAAGAIAAGATSNYAQKAARLTTGNSKQEQLFKGVDFRTFSFEYEFQPKSEAEAASVLQIIRMFKHHMLPEYWDSLNFMYIYPSEFEVKYYSGTAENEYLEKQMTAVLTQCSINYTPDGQFNTFANGMPTKIKMQLQFKELAVPTKETSPYDSRGI